LSVEQAEQRDRWQVAAWSVGPPRVRAWPDALTRSLIGEAIELSKAAYRELTAA
jgi:predicted alpha/beta hydrolase